MTFVKDVMHKIQILKPKHDATKNNNNNNKYIKGFALQLKSLEDVKRCSH
jgi:hypothetical protein